MDKTQNDLSYNETKLDYQALVSTAKIAYAHCVEEVGRHLQDIRQLHPKYLPHLSAQWLLREAEQLVIAAETMETLMGGLERERLEVINKPPIIREVTNEQ